MTLPAHDHDQATDDWIIRIPGRRDGANHWRRAYEYDVSSLAVGRDGPYGYRGRPELARLAVAAYRDILGGDAPPRTMLYAWLRNMGRMWIALDAFEREHDGRVIEGLSDLEKDVWVGIKLRLASKGKKLAKETYRTCEKTIDRAHELAGSAERAPASSFSHDGIADYRKTGRPYSVELEIAMRDAFRADRTAVEVRIAESHGEADSGDPNTLERYEHRRRGDNPSIWTRANRLRFARDRLLETLPDKNEFVRRFGFKHDAIGCPPKAPVPVALEGVPEKDFQRGLGMGLAALYRNFIPTERDIAPFMCELAFHDGWNMETIRDLNRRDWFTGDPEQGDVYIHSRKMRSDGDIQTIMSGTGPNSAYRLIRSAIDITECSSKWVDRMIGLLEEQSPTPAVAARLDQLREIQDRVWLVLRLDRTGIDAVTVDTRQTWDVANEILKRRGVEEDGAPARWSIKRLRNRVMSDIFVAAGCDIVATSRAAGHESPATTDGYLDHLETDEMETELIRRRLDELALRQNWPTPLPERPTSVPGKPRLLVTPAGRDWLRALPAGIASALPFHEPVR